MSFPPAVREEVLVRSARRCCVCREFKGLGIEVHHIKPEADGGSSDISNAIALCFDCHMSAGHYNPRQPRGSKFSPEELKRHRAKHWADVEAGRVSTASPSVAGIHVRYVVALTYDQAKEVLEGGFSNEHFKLNRLCQTAVSKFMQVVLGDDLPQPRNPLVSAGLATPGFLAVGKFWETREQLVADHPEFANVEKRPVESDDIALGLLRSKLLAACFRAGLPARELGELCIHHNLCGGESWFTEYKLRRPLFVFTNIENIGTNTLTITGVVGAAEEPAGPDPRALAGGPSSGSDQIEVAPVALRPGEALTVPWGVLLSPTEEDDLSLEWMEEIPKGVGTIDFASFSSASARLGPAAYLKVGPCFQVTSIDVATEVRSDTVETRPFDVRRVYLLGRAWMMGSCPQAVIELENGTLIHFGEILAEADGRPAESTLLMPKTARWFHICEFEFETTTIHSVKIASQEMIDAPVTLTRGDCLSFAVTANDSVRIRGEYRSILGEPVTTEERRLKRSLVAGGLRVFAFQRGGFLADRELANLVLQ